MSQEPTNISTYFYDTSSIALSFTEASSNIFNPAQTYYYMAQATDISGLKTTYATGKTSPIFITGLSAGFTYTCYLYTVQTASSDSIAIITLSYPSIDSISFSELSMNSIKVKWVGSDISYVKITKSIGTNNNYIDISSNSLITPYSDRDIIGNTTYYYYVTPYMTKYGSLITGSASNILTGTTPVAPATDLSAIFYDTSGIRISFTASNNSYTTSVSYIFRAVNNSTGLYKEVSGNSPLMITDLSSGILYNCYIINILDSSYVGISNVLNVTTTSSLSDNLIYYYKFDNGDIANGLIADYSTGSKVYGGVATSGTITTSGYKVGNGFYTGSSTRRLSLPTFNTGSTRTGFTLAFWYKYSGNPYVYNGVVGFVKSWAGDCFSLRLGVEPNSRNLLSLVVNGSNFDTTDALNTNTWYHIVFVLSKDNTSICSFYLNNVLKKQSTFNYPSLNTTYTNCSVNGADDAINNSTVSSPCMDDLRLYRKPLTATEISLLFNNTV